MKYILLNILKTNIRKILLLKSENYCIAYILVAKQKKLETNKDQLSKTS